MAEIFTFRFECGISICFCCVNCLRVLFRVVLFSHIISGSHQTFQSVLGINRSFQLSYQNSGNTGTFLLPFDPNFYITIVCAFVPIALTLLIPFMCFFIKALLAELDSRILGMNFLSVFL